jgi:3-ketosteroid 9alpha-monooxygenase subunit B
VSDNPILADAHTEDARADGARARHGYHELRVKEVVDETADTRSFVLDVPVGLRDAFRYRSGQFCTFRIRSGEQEHARCYSMSSAPETDADLTVTVKRVPGGLVSNWFNDRVTVGDVLEVTRPSGTFCRRDGSRPVFGFCGGSGITPVLSITKSVLASSTPVRLLYANRDRDSVIFGDVLQDLHDRHGDRLDLRLHFDTDRGFLEPGAIAELVTDGPSGPTDADYYICGPGPFMDLVERVLLDVGVDPAAILIERFETAGPRPAAVVEAPVVEVPVAEVPEAIVLILRGKKHEIPYRAGDTVLETARRANLPAPYSCESGSCATCMALAREGTVAMRANDALTGEEVDEGWVLTCQSEPTSASLTIEYEPL